MYSMNVDFKILDLAVISLLSVMAMGKGMVWERLDRAMDTMEWMDMFPASKVVHLKSGSSNYKPFMIYLASIPKRINKPWRFEQMWMEDEGCREVVEDAWAYDS